MAGCSNVFVDRILQEQYFPIALSTQSRRQVFEKRRVSWSSDFYLGHGGQQQASDSSASGANSGGEGARSTQDGGMARRRRQIESLVARGGSGTDSSEDRGRDEKGTSAF